MLMRFCTCFIGDQEHGPGDQSPGQGPELYGSTEGFCGNGQVRAAGAEPGRTHIGRSMRMQLQCPVWETVLGA